MKSLLIRLGVILVVFWIVVILHSTVSAYDIEFTRKGLRGLKGVYVSMKDLTPDAIDLGITKDQIQIDVELKLRLAGIKVLTKEEMISTLGEPCLYLSITNEGQVYFLCIGKERATLQKSFLKGVCREQE